MVYSDAHRLFLQVMSQRRSLAEREASELMDQCCREFGVKAQTLEGFVQELNLELQHMQLAVRNATEEGKDGDYPCLVLVNLMAGEATRDLSSFTKQELTFIQQLVGEILATENGEVGSNTALNLCHVLPQKMKLSHCEDLIQLLLRDKWLIQIMNEDGEEFVSLSALTMVELATYLEESHAEDVHKCFFCTKMTVKGHQCDQCNISVHRDCGKKYWANRGGGYECPGQGCKASLLPLASSSQPKRSRTKHTEKEIERMEEEEEEEYEELEVEEKMDVLKKGRGTGRCRRKRNIVEV